MRKVRKEQLSYILYSILLHFVILLAVYVFNFLRIPSVSEYNNAVNIDLDFTVGEKKKSATKFRKTKSRVNKKAIQTHNKQKKISVANTIKNDVEHKKVKDINQSDVIDKSDKIINSANNATNTPSARSNVVKHELKNIKPASNVSKATVINNKPNAVVKASSKQLNHSTKHDCHNYVESSVTEQDLFAEGDSTGNAFDKDVIENAAYIKAKIEQHRNFTHLLQCDIQSMYSVVLIRLNIDGSVIEIIDLYDNISFYVNSSVRKALLYQNRRAIALAAPFDKLSSKNFDKWKQITLKFTH